MKYLYIYIYVGVGVWVCVGVYTYMRDSLVVQLIKNPPAMQETPVRFLSWKDPREKG